VYGRGRQGALHGASGTKAVGVAMCQASFTSFKR
jgi:hypothetical protein